MVRIGKSRRGDDSRLSVIAGKTPASAAPTGDDLAELRDMLTAAGAPREVLQVLEAGGDPDELMGQLIAAGLLPSPQDSLAELMDSWKPLLKPGYGSFDAELTGVEFLSMMRAALPDADELPEILAGLIAQCEAYGRPEALAALRVLAVIGPQQVRQAAAESADRLAAAGVRDRPWVKGLGVPQVGAAFGYADTVGAQESVTVTFAYGRKRHSITALIDHDLGGGVKDVFPSDAPDQVREQCVRLAQLQPQDMEFRDHTPAEARTILARALAKDPCPAADDQIEDVGDYLDLLRQRVTLLPSTETGPRGTRNSSGGKSVDPRTIHQIKVTLRGSKPPIWRRLEVPSDLTLAQLHLAIQEAFGWQNCHLWVFETADGSYGVTDPELGHRAATSKKLAQVAPRPTDTLSYTYDFGDDWEHAIAVEDVFDAEAGVAYPRCVAGRRAGPPEDCGGIWGHAELLEVLAEPGHDDHTQMLQWLGLETPAELDPAAFNLAEANDRLSGQAKIVRKR